VSDPFKLFNTLGRDKQVFEPIDPGHVRVYACGPTVYDYAHIGNARMAVVSDQLVRVLRHIYPKVTYVSNITDVDDKILNRAEELGVEMKDITQKYARIYNQDMARLGVGLPDLQPKATEHIQSMIEMIQRILANKGGYVDGGHVYFDVRSLPAYGGLSGRTLDELNEGVRIEVSEHKRHFGDFVLWKPSQDHEVGWQSPWGRGRPGWHIECSAMSFASLGLPFDIHAGGVDLVFPHHENEIAQACCATGNQSLDAYAKILGTNGFVMHEGQKMSKSIGNILLVHDLVKEHAPVVLRLLLLKTHYRQPLNWTSQGLENAKLLFQRILDIFSIQQPQMGTINQDVWAALLDDLNTPLALVHIEALIRKIRENGYLSEDVNQLYASVVFLGLMDADHLAVVDLPSPGEIEALLAKRELARKSKNFKVADHIRQSLLKQGVEILDTAGKSTWKYRL